MYEVVNRVHFIGTNVNCCKFVTARHKYNPKKQLKVDRLTSSVNLRLSSPLCGVNCCLGS